MIGTAIGAFHGVFIAYVHIPPFITTLAGMLLWRGVATIVLAGKPIAPFPQKYLNLFESFLSNVSAETAEKFGEVDFMGEYVDKITLITTLIVTLICVLVYVILEIISRQKKD